MDNKRSGRRASFLDRAAQQGRRPSLFEQAVHAIQSQTSGNNELAVPLNFRYLLVILAGLSALPFFLPTPILLLGALPLAMLYVITDFFRVWDPNWTLKIALKQYLIVRAMYVVGIYESWQYHRDSLKVGKSQERTLLKLLSINADTAYSHEHKLAEIKNSSDFIRSQPLTKYAHYAPYVERMMNGETKVLTSESPTYFGKTSGTTGKPSIVPFTNFMKKQQLGIYALFSYVAQKQVQWEELHRLRPIWKISYINPKILETTPSGITMGPTTANPMWTKMGEIYTVPTIAFQIEDSVAGGYVQLIFALLYRDLGAIEGIFASLVYFSFKKLEAEWRSLVENIRYGTIRQDLNIPDEIREPLLSFIKPDPARADELEVEFEKGFDNIATRIWPELKIINCITTGPFAIYARYLREHYTRNILLYSSTVAATEGFIGVNFWPYIQPTQYALLPKMHFYEFIPAEMSGEEKPRTFLMDQVHIGRDYELVVTTASGFNRYRIGDVIRVVSFYNQVPIVEFRHRAGGSLNIRGEKVTELSMIDCLNEAALTLTPDLERIVDYTSCENVLLDVIDFKYEKKGSHHVLFVEMATKNSHVNQMALAAKLSSKYDEVLRKNHYKYLELRTTQSLEEAIIYPIKKGGFNRLREYMLKTSNVSPIQLKIPRILQKTELIHFVINERIVSFE